MLIKHSLGKLSLPSPATEFLFGEMARNEVSLLPVTRTHLAELEGLAMIHRDPFDRMLVAQAKAERLAIVTGDREIKKYGVSLL
jgi:PIN domain nuclease of toxin-antitoxin system